MIDEINYGTVKTPCYIINSSKLEENIGCVSKAFKENWGDNFSIAYSIKTNHFPYLLKMSKELGCIAEAVSNDEYMLAMNVGFDPVEIIYNGPQKKGDTFLFAIKNGSIINIDNFSDIEFLEQNLKYVLAGNCKLGIRINFDLESICNNETTTGNEVSRFGVCTENGDFEKAVRRIHALGLPVSGLHLHYSTKTRSLKVFRALAEMAAILIKRYNLRSELSFIDIGGGFFGGRQDEKYPSMNEYAKVISESLNSVKHKDVTLIVEPGASILATAVDYVTRVINTRDIRKVKVVTMDGSLLHVDPLYSKKSLVYEFFPKRRDKSSVQQVVCGSTCMENDRFLKLENQAVIFEGDMLCIKNAGAYTMSFNNCFIDVPPYVYLEKDGVYTCLRDKLHDLMQKL